MGERASSDFDAQHSAQGIQGQDSLEFVSYKDGKADAAALIGDVTTDKAPAPCWRLTWEGWRGGVAPARFATRLNEVEAMALALAAAACAAEAEVEGERKDALSDNTGRFPNAEKVRRLSTLGAMGERTATVLVAEVYRRSFETR